MVIKKITVMISFVLLGIMVVNASPFYYNFGLDYNNGNIDIKSAGIEFSQNPESLWNYFNSSSTYYLEIVDKDNKVLNKTFFSPQIFAIYDFGDENGTITGGRFVEFENVSFVVIVPYYENAYQLIIYDETGNELDKAFLSQFSRTGFDNEDFKDVEKIGEDVAGEDVDKRKVSDVTSGPNYQNYVIILVILLMILITILIYFLKKKK